MSKHLFLCGDVRGCGRLDEPGCLDGHRAAHGGRFRRRGREAVLHAHHRLDMAGTSGRGEWGFVEDLRKPLPFILFWKDGSSPSQARSTLRAGLTVNRGFPTRRAF